MNNRDFSMEEYQTYCNDYCGLCLECGEIADGVEPDAEGYLCEFCDETSVMGFELALVCGEITIT